MDISELLAFAYKKNASDLHLSAGMPPVIRVDGDIKRINVDTLDDRAVHRMIYDIMNDKQQKAFEEGATMVRIGTALFGPRPKRAAQD